jgi:WD40 repeat protein
MFLPIGYTKKALWMKPQQEMRGYIDRAHNVALVPGGRKIMTCSFDGSIRIWDIESGTQIGDDWGDDNDRAEGYTITLSPNGKTVAIGDIGGKVTLWDVETRKFIAKWTGHTNFVTSLCWSQDGERLVSGSWDGTVRVRDVKSGKTVLGVIQTGHKYVYVAIYSPDTTKIATGGGDDSGARIWDAKTGELLSTVLKQASVVSLAWTSDQTKLIFTSDTSIRIFNTATWQQIAILQGHTDTFRSKGFVCSLSLFQNDRLLASASSDHTARLWYLHTHLAVGPPLQHQAAVESAAISADGKQLITGCADHNAYVWDIHTTIKDAGLVDVSVN